MRRASAVTPVLVSIYNEAPPQMTRWFPVANQSHGILAGMTGCIWLDLNRHERMGIGYPGVSPAECLLGP